MGTELNLWWLSNRTVVSASDRVPTSIPLRLSFVDNGPSGFERLVRNRAGATYTSAYGSFVADESRRLFLFYIAEYEVGGARGIAALIDRARAAWPGWQVSWAVGGEPQVRQFLSLLATPEIIAEAHDNSGCSLLHRWLRSPSSPDAIAALLDSSPEPAPVLTDAQARDAVQGSLRACLAEANQLLEGIDDDTGELRIFFFRDSARYAGTDVTLIHQNKTITARVPAPTPLLLVDPEHVIELLQSFYSPLFDTVDPTAPHGPPEAIWLDHDRRTLHLLPTPDNVRTIIALLHKPVWRDWMVSFQPPPSSH
jgi:hypothetical protein